MPELTPQSTPPSPLDWEDRPAFRETFLLHFTRPEDRTALEHLGRMLYEMALELARLWPQWQETSNRAEMRAVAADLRHAEAFLRSVAATREEASLSPEDERLAVIADTYAVEVGRTAKGLETIVGPFWKGGRRIT